MRRRTAKKPASSPENVSTVAAITQLTSQDAPSIYNNSTILNGTTTHNSVRLAARKKQPTISISTVTVPRTQDASTIIITPTSTGPSCNSDVNQFHSATHQFGIRIYKSHYGHVQPPKIKHTDASISNYASRNGRPHRQICSSDRCGC